MHKTCNINKNVLRTNKVHREDKNSRYEFNPKQSGHMTGKDAMQLGQEECENPKETKEEPSGRRNCKQTGTTLYHVQKIVYSLLSGAGADEEKEEGSPPAQAAQGLDWQG